MYMYIQNVESFHFSLQQYDADAKLLPIEQFAAEPRLSTVF